MHGTVEIQDAWMGRSSVIGGDTVASCTQKHANGTLYHGLKAVGCPVKRIGDCLALREADDAMREGAREGFEFRVSTRST